MSGRRSERPVGAGSAPALPSASDWERWGIDPSWSVTVPVVGHDGITRQWHVLDRPAVGPSAGTIVCVHGNPTWSFLWRSFLRRIDPSYRIIAVDQLGMGFSERTASRRYAVRVRDLDDVISTLTEGEPIVLAGHDWGGAVVMGWAVAHRERVRGLMLANTGIAIPAGTRGPSVIRLASKMTAGIGYRTPVFVEGTIKLAGDRLNATGPEGLRAPYRDARFRHAVGEFIADAPFDDRHPSAASLAIVAEQVRSLTCPVLLVFGAKDPVFADTFADDLAERFPHADRHRFATASHLSPEEADVAGVADRWLRERLAAPPALAAAEPADIAGPFRPSWAAIGERNDAAVAFHDGATGSSVTFAELHRQVEHVAAVLRSRGVKAGDRIALAVPPSVELVAAVYGCWRAGAVTVIADRGLGLAGLGRAVKGARVGWVLGTRSTLVAAAGLRWAPQATRLDIADVLSASPLPALTDSPEPDGLAALLFTSGATGPAKPVRYTHRALAAQRDALAATYGITSDDRLVAAFAPFALYGPALGITSAVPDCDVTKPGSLTADILAAACRSIDATMAFGSPAALANVVATRGTVAPLPGLRVVMSAGAPVPAETLRAMKGLAPNATFHTPYGMTEVLPVADIELSTIESAEHEAALGRGVCVGFPVAGATVMIAPLGFDASVPVSSVGPGVTGEILVHAPWMSAGYDGLWLTQAEARPTDGAGTIWHRSGDVGRFDTEGRLWVEGRSVHVIHAVGGALTPVPVERRVEQELRQGRAAAVGLGPVGCQVLVVVIEGGSDGLADRALATRVRSIVDEPVAAVLRKKSLPVDIRHNAKIDRTALARWAGSLLGDDSA